MRVPVISCRQNWQKFVVNVSLSESNRDFGTLSVKQSMLARALTTSAVAYTLGYFLSKLNSICQIINYASISET